MKLITRFELAAKETQELHPLYRDVFNAVARTNPGSQERRNALASLENISRELATRCAP